MSRRCDCKGLMDAARLDPRLKTIPAGARWMWLMLADAMARLPEPGVLLLGSRIGSAAEVSMMVSMPETEVETYLETLLETGLLNRRGDGVITLPELPGATRRTSASRENGGFGGRPRKNETVEQARVRRVEQRNLPLMSVHSGRQSETQETYDETQPDKPLAAASLASKAERKQLVGFVELGAELAEIARMDNARGTFTYGPVKAWLTEGATPALLRDVISTIANRASYTAPDRLNYFTKAVRDALQAAGGTAPATQAPANAEREAVFKAYNIELQAYIDNGCRGERPRHPFQQEAAA